MEVKILEIRDIATFIPVVAINMNPDPLPIELHAVQRYYLSRFGFPCDGRPNIAIFHLGCSGQLVWNDPYGWGGRTYPVAHTYIIDHWAELQTGDVVDVEFILKEKPAKKVSERLEH